MKIPKVRKFLRSIQDVLIGLSKALFGFVLTFFESVNRMIRSGMTFLRMQEETSEHVQMLVKTLKYLVFPVSIFYICADLYFFRENAVDSAFWGILTFLYSNFLPDLPSIFRKKASNGRNQDLPWYKKYIILVLAPLFIWLLFSGTRLGWKTTETFHNFRSLAAFGIFLLLCGFFAFGDFPFNLGDLTETLSLPLYGIAGYLVHLKVDKIW